MFSPVVRLETFCDIHPLQHFEFFESTWTCKFRLVQPRAFGKMSKMIVLPEHTILRDVFSQNFCIQSSLDKQTADRSLRTRILVSLHRFYWLFHLFLSGRGVSPVSLVNLASSVQNLIAKSWSVICYFLASSIDNHPVRSWGLTDWDDLHIASPGAINYAPDLRKRS